MLVQFSVANFLSFRDRAVLNLTALNRDDTHPNNYLEDNGQRYLRSAVIYGANAAGKSSLLKAMTAAIMIIRESSSIQVDTRISRIVPFLLNEESRKKPSEFEFIFIADGIRYVYGFSATQKRIVDEYLYAYYSSKRSLIFNRTNTTVFRFTKADDSEFSAYKEKTTDNKLFLATATAWNCQKTKPAFLWFSERIDTLTDNEFSDPGIALKKYHEAKTPGLGNFTIKLLNNADINIDGFNVEAREVAHIQLPGIMPIPGTAYDVTTDHLMPDKNTYQLPLAMESLGTQNLFFLSPFLFDAITKGKTIFIDEMSCLHSNLVRFLVTRFIDPAFNKKNAQLIFATHDTNFLDLELFRRDQIYFIEKDEYGNSELYGLDNFSVRKNEKIRLGYILGRYGAVPIIGGEEML